MITVIVRGENPKEVAASIVKLNRALKLDVADKVEGGYTADVEGADDEDEVEETRASGRNGTSRSKKRKASPPKRRASQVEDEADDDEDDEVTREMVQKKIMEVVNKAGDTKAGIKNVQRIYRKYADGAKKLPEDEALYAPVLAACEAQIAKY